MLCHNTETLSTRRRTDKAVIAKGDESDSLQEIADPCVIYTTPMRVDYQLPGQLVLVSRVLVSSQRWIQYQSSALGSKTPTPIVEIWQVRPWIRLQFWQRRRRTYQLQHLQLRVIISNEWSTYPYVSTELVYLCEIVQTSHCSSIYLFDNARVRRSFSWHFLLSAQVSNTNRQRYIDLVTLTFDLLTGKFLVFDTH